MRRLNGKGCRRRVGTSLRKELQVIADAPDAARLGQGDCDSICRDCRDGIFGKVWGELIGTGEVLDFQSFQKHQIKEAASNHEENLGVMQDSLMRWLRPHCATACVGASRTV